MSLLYHVQHTTANISIGPTTSNRLSDRLLAYVHSCSTNVSLMSSQIRLFVVCLQSAYRLSVTLLRPIERVELFGNILALAPSNRLRTLIGSVY